MTENLMTELDIEIIQRIQKRKVMSGGPVGKKEDDPLVQWSKELDVDPTWLLRFFGIMDGVTPYQHPFPQLATLQEIISVVRRTSHGGIDFYITHIEQYPDCSVVRMIIDNPDPHAYRFHGIGLHPPTVQMRISGIDCRTYRSHWVHEENRIQAGFVAVPRLPDELEDIEFHLAMEGAQITHYEAAEIGTHVELNRTSDSTRNSLQAREKRGPLRSPYNEEYRSYDEKTIRLVANRKALGMTFVHQDFETLSKQLDVSLRWLQQYANTVNHVRSFDEYLKLVKPTIPMNLRGDVYPSQSAYHHGIHFYVSKVQQYENCSFVEVDAWTDADTNLSFRNFLNWSFPRLVVPDHNCSRHGGGGGGPSMRFRFKVTPALPDDLVGVHMALEFEGPYAFKPSTVEVKTIIL